MKLTLYLRKINTIILVMLLLMMTFTATGCGNEEEDDGSGYSFTCTLYENPQNLDPQLATDKSSLTVIKNMFTGLMTLGANGKIEYGVAKSYEVSDDGLKYTFVLRDNCHWHSSAGPEGLVTAHDFVYAFKRIFDPVMRSPYAEKFSFLQNAKSIMNGDMEFTELGVYAVNNTELVFCLDEPNSEFLYLLTTAPAMPCNKRFFEGTKARYGLDDESVISNGAFYISQWAYDPYGSDNLIYMKRNYENSANDRVYPYMLTFIIERDSAAAAENFTASVTDCFVSETAQKKSFMGAIDVKSYETTSYGIIFNKNLNIDSDIKKMLSLTVDRKGLESVAPENFKVAYGIIPGSLYVGDNVFREQYPAISYDFYSADTEEMLPDVVDRINRDYPDGVNILVMNKSEAGVIGKIVDDWQDELGIYVRTDYVEEDEYYSRLEEGEYFMAFAEISSDDSSVYYYLRNVIDEIYNEDDAYETKSLLDTSLSCISDDIKCKIYRDAENAVMEAGDYIPLFYRKLFLIYRKNVSDLEFNPFSEQLDFEKAKYFK
ncbi:MAG: ABC transporter substrate-binding protein [Oscillospiraceae bacterium]